MRVVAIYRCGSCGDEFYVPVSTEGEGRNVTVTSSVRLIDADPCYECGEKYVPFGEFRAVSSSPPRERGK